MLVARRALDPLLDDAARRGRRRGRAWPTLTGDTGWSGGRCSSRRCRRRSGCAPRRGCRGWTAPRPAWRDRATASSRCRWAGPVGSRGPGGRGPRRGRARAGRAGRAVARRSACRRPRLAAALGMLAGVLAQDRSRRDAARPAGGRRGQRARRAGPRRLVGDGPQAQPGRGRSRCSRAPSACPGWWRPCSRRWSRSTSARPGAWQAEWGTLTRAAGADRLGGGLGRELLERLEVDADRMRENLGRGGERRADRSTPISSRPAAS